MATKQVSKARVDWCYRALVDGRATHRVVAELAEREGISRRMARNYVGRAYQELAQDLEDDGLGNKQYLARMIASLEAAIEQGIAQGHGNTVIGATRLLSELLGIGADYRQQSATGRYGRTTHHA